MALLFLAALPLAAEKKWTEVRSQHFIVITDSHDTDGRRVAVQFEQMRAVFEQAFPGFVLDDGSEMVIFAARDTGTMKELLPEYWKKSGGAKPAGVFMGGWQHKWAVVNLESQGPESGFVVYHEYVHSILHMNMRWIPTWLDEGLADFYGFSSFYGKEAHVGSPGPRLITLHKKMIVPLRELLAVDQSSPWYTQDDKADRFYATAWGLTHYLRFGQGMERGKRLNEYIDALDRGEDPLVSFEKEFGKIEKVESDLQAYARQVAFYENVRSNPANIDLERLPARQLTSAEATAVLALWQLHKGQIPRATELVDQALKAGPQTAIAHEAAAFLRFREGNDVAALEEFEQAVTLDPKRLSTMYFRAMLHDGSPKNADDNARLISDLQQTLQIDPDFAPGYVALSRALASAGRFDEAIVSARRAMLLAPTRAGYHLNVTRILERYGEVEGAVAEARFVAQRWKGSDRDEALALLDRMKADPPEPHPPLPVGYWMYKGVLQSVVCSKEESVLVVKGRDGLRTFQTQGFSVGFSDTLWYGSDYFTPCLRVRGLDVVVEYKPAADGKPETVGKIELREEMPAPFAKPRVN